METAAERLYRLLLTHPKDSWTQRALAAHAGCSPGQVSKVVGSLAASGALGRPYKNRVVLTGPARLLMLWAARRSLLAPTFVATARTAEAVEAILRASPGCALTLFRAAWHRTKFMRTTTVEAYIPKGNLASLVARIGSPSAEPTSVALYPAQGAELEGLEMVGGLPLVSVPQNFVDLMAVGGQGPRVAMHLARAHGLFGD